MPDTDTLIWGGAPLSVKVWELFSDELEGDFEIVPEESVKPRWHTLKRWLNTVGFSKVERTARYDRFALCSQVLALTHDGRFLLEGIRPPTIPTALALVQLFLLCDAATERRGSEVDDEVVEGGG